MTVASTVRKAGPFLADGINASFPFDFKVFVASDVVVTQLNLSNVESTLALTTDYSVALNPDQNAAPGGTVTCTSIPTAGFYITLTSDVPESQTLTLTNSGGFYPAVLNDALDRAVILLQQLAEILGRSITLPVSVDGVSVELPRPQAGAFLGWDGSGTSIANLAGVTGVTVSSPMQPVVGAVSLAAALSLLGGMSVTQGVNSSLQWLTGIGGTTDAITGTPSVQPAAHAAGQVWRFKSGGVNTGAAMTLKVGTLAALPLTHLAGRAPFAGDVQENQVITAINVDGSNLQMLPGPTGIRLGNVITASTGSPSTIDWTNVPSWLNRATFFFNGVSLSAVANLRFQLGSGGSPAAAGYVGAEGRLTATPSAGYNAGSAAGFEILAGNNTRTVTGRITFTKMTGNIWVADWVSFMDDAATDSVTVGTGLISLAGVMNIIRLTSTGADTFDAGTVNYIYE